MKHIKPFLFLTLLVLLGCERDDICAEGTPTTPNALIEFYDVSNPETLKTVSGLFVIGEGQTDAIPDVNGVTTSSIRVPLRTDAEESKFFFISEVFVNDNGTPDDPDDDFLDGNIDEVTISYQTEEVYVSRACGFKTVFNNINVSIDPGTDGVLWILADLFVAENQAIANENQTHIHFRH